MATLHGQQMTKLRVSPRAVPAPGYVDGTVRCFVETVSLASQGTADTVEVARLPKGAVPLYGVLNSDTSLGTSTLAVGVSGDSGRYRAAATFTATDTPTLFAPADEAGAALAAEEIVFLSIGTAALPASGTLRVMLFYAVN